jgi:alpha-L-rhamnosidase
MLTRLGLLLFACVLCVGAQSPENLRCEWQTQPIAIQTTAPRFSWTIAAGSENRIGIRQTAYRVIVASGKTAITRHLGDMWDSGRVNSSDTLQITYAGKTLASASFYYWAVQTWDQDGMAHWGASTFQTGLLLQKDWSATWISAAISPESVKSLPLFRRDFVIAKRVARAVVYVSGLGQYELHLNGEKLGDGVLAPGWTDYRKTVLYNAFDVTAALHKGGNVFGVLLGNGMYNVENTKDRYTKFVASMGTPKLLLQAQISFSDGTSMRLVSDHNWRTIQGPITFSSTYGGEDYDARMEQPGWDRPGFREKDWLEAQETEGPGGKLAAQQSPPIKVGETFKPVRVTEPKPGTFVYDLGQNFSGWPLISVTGPRGSSIKLIPGELLDRDGLASQRSSGDPQWYAYTLSGQGTESWSPRFSYWGFRYVQVERQPDNGVMPELVSLSGQFIHDAAPETGQFESSDDLLNRIHRLIDAAIKSNMQSVLTDCPHREKLGWLEESHLLGSALMYNFDLATLYEKISNDMSDSQQADGLVPDISPEYVVFDEGFRDSPEWGSAVVLDPWLTYQHYGDSGSLAAHYDSMKRYAAYLASKASGNIIAYGLGDWYDIGPGEPGVSKLTSLGVTATAIYYQDLVTLAKTAKVLGKPSEEAGFRSQAASVRESFNKRFYTPETHVYDRSSQTDYAMPLVLGLVPDQDRGVVLDKLVEDIRAHNNHVTAGDIGFHYVVEALMDNGRSDVLFDMLSRTDSPSYGFQLARGATSLTEAWDANPLDSQNHFMLGHAEEWFYRGLAGIDFDLSRPEPERIVIRPSPVGKLTSAQATYNSVLGIISSKWSNQDGGFVLTVDIPANTIALIKFPAAKAAADDPAGVSLKNSENGISTYQVVSGHYVFRSKQLRVE